MKLHSNMYTYHFKRALPAIKRCNTLRDMKSMAFKALDQAKITPAWQRAYHIILNISSEADLIKYMEAAINKAELL